MLIEYEISDGHLRSKRVEAESSAIANGRTLYVDGHLNVQGHLNRFGAQASDSAPLALELFHAQGVDGLCAAIAGEYAIVVEDIGGVLHLIPDLLDNQPLYYADCAGPRRTRLVVIGNNLARVADVLRVRARQSCTPDTLFLAALLADQTDVLQMTQRTPLHGIRRVPGGYRVTLNTANEWQPLQRCWNPAIESLSLADVPEAVDRLDATIADAVQASCAYGPPCVMLSGGVDSGLVAAYAARRLGARVGGVTLGLSAWPEVQEVQGARRTAAAVGMSLRIVDCNAVTPYTDLQPASVYRNGLPINALSAYQVPLANTAASGGAKVMMTGDGGDEFWGVEQSPAYLWELAKQGRFGRTAQHLRLWSRHLGTGPIGVITAARAAVRWQHQYIPDWLCLPPEMAQMRVDSGHGFPLSVQGRARMTRFRLNMTENWHNLAAVYAPRGMKLLHPLRDRALAELSYALPQWIVQHPGQYKWLMRRLADTHYGDMAFDSVGSDYSHLVNHGLLCERERLLSYLDDDCRLLRYGLVTPDALPALREFLRDPGGSDWGIVGESQAAQHAFEVEMYLRGWEQAEGETAGSVMSAKFYKIGGMYENTLVG